MVGTKHLCIYLAITLSISCYYKLLSSSQLLHELPGEVLGVARHPRPVRLQRGGPLPGGGGLLATAAAAAIVVAVAVASSSSCQAGQVGRQTSGQRPSL